MKAPPPTPLERTTAVSPILRVFEHEELSHMHTLPVPRPPAYREQVLARHEEMAADRQKAMVGPIRNHIGLSQE